MMNIFVWLFESSLLIVMILGIRKFFIGKVSYCTIYALWGIVLLRLVLPVNLFSTHISLENLFVGEQEASVGQGQDNVNEEPSSGVAHTGVTGASEKKAGQKIVSTDDVKKDVQAEERENLYKEAERRENASQSAIGQGKDAGEKSPANTVGRGEHILEGIVFLWACVAWALLCWITFSNLRFLWEVKKNRILLGSRGRLKVYAADVPGSCLYGVFRPSVYLPVYLIRSCLGGDCQGVVEKEKNEEERQAESMLAQIGKHPQLSQVIAHEFTHYRHRDHIWAMVRTAMLVVYWFNPLVWLAAWISGKDAELCCDEATIRQLGEEKRFDYGEMLIHLAGSAGREKLLYSAVFMSRRGKDMEKRIRAISERKQYSRWIAVPLIILLLVAVGVTCSRAVGSQQPGNAVDLVKNDTVETTEEMAAKAKEEAARQANMQESLEIYQSFLKGHGDDGKYRYYSLVEMEKGQYVLLTAGHVMVVDADTDMMYSLWSTSNCQVHCINSGEVVSCGKIACSSSGEWIHIVEDAGTEKHMLATDTHHSVSHYSLKAGEAKLTEDIREEYKEGQKTEYLDWIDGFYASPSVVFFTNPAVGDVKKNEPQALELTKDTVGDYAKKILSHASLEMNKDVTGDGVKDTIRVDFDKVEAPASDMEDSVTVISGSSGEKIYGLNVNLVHGGWQGVYYYEKDGQGALMTWQPAMYQGIAKYQWEIFVLSEDGKETILAQDSLSFDLNNVREDDPEKLEKFVEKLNSYLKDASRLALVSDGRVLEGNEADYERGGHYKGEFDSDGNWNVMYTAEEELKAMREALDSKQAGE